MNIFSSDKLYSRFLQDIKESDYFTERGEFRVDSEGSPTLLNCLMYKLSYYRYVVISNFHTICHSIVDILVVVLFSLFPYILILVVAIISLLSFLMIRTKDSDSNKMHFYFGKGGGGANSGNKYCHTAAE